MKLTHVVVAIASVFLSVAAIAEKKIVAYVPNWIDLKSFSEKIDFKSLTHIDLAFENPDKNDELSFNKADEFLIAKARANHVSILLSIGGGSASTDKTLRARYTKLLGDSQRAAFVKHISQYLTKHEFDGLDVDIEGPAIDKNYGAFISALAKELKPKKLLLTAAVSKGYGGDKIADATLGEFDLVNIMAYDGKGSWNANDPGQHSSLEFAKENVTYWLGRGVAKNKAVLGVPFYGYGFGKAFRKSPYSYKEILAANPGAEKVDQIGSTIWYNGIPTIKAKTQYVIDQDLAGMMIWSLDNDGPGEKSLLSAMAGLLKPRP